MIVALAAWYIRPSSRHLNLLIQPFASDFFHDTCLWATVPEQPPTVVIVFSWTAPNGSLTNSLAHSDGRGGCSAPSCDRTGRSSLRMMMPACEEVKDQGGDQKPDNSYDNDGPNGELVVLWSRKRGRRWCLSSCDLRCHFAFRKRRGLRSISVRESQVTRKKCQACFGRA